MKVNTSKRWPTTLPAPVCKIEVRAALTATNHRRQFALFEDASRFTLCDRHVSSDFEQLINRLSSRLGPQAVTEARLQSEVLPENAFRYQPLAGRKRSGGRRATGRHQKCAGLRPLYLYPNPVQLLVVSIVPDGPPISFRYDGLFHRIDHTWGPERIETGWWKGSTIRRDYFRVEDHVGCRFWIFRELGSGDWYLHGVF